MRDEQQLKSTLLTGLKVANCGDRCQSPSSDHRSRTQRTDDAAVTHTLNYFVESVHATRGTGVI